MAEEVDKKLEEILEQVMPLGFAIVKETATRFAKNDFVEVTANDFDRNIAALHDHVEIIDDKARWNSTWNAGGNDTDWNMIHYDVQLSGGAVLHKGNTAGMATG